jgi:hypothetical protein
MAGSCLAPHASNHGSLSSRSKEMIATSAEDFYEPSNIVCDYLMWLSGGATELCGLEPDRRYLQMQNDCVRTGM